MTDLVGFNRIKRDQFFAQRTGPAHEGWAQRDNDI